MFQLCFSISLDVDLIFTLKVTKKYKSSAFLEKKIIKFAYPFVVLYKCHIVIFCRE